MSHIAPRLTPKGFRTGCSQPGPAHPMLDEVIHEGIRISFTANGIIFSAEEGGSFTARQVLKRFDEAIASVRCRSARVATKS